MLSLIHILVICNNDEMALGAAEALERAGDTRGVKVVGIDGTPQGIEGLKSGKLYGTCLLYTSLFGRFSHDCRNRAKT